jgi:hypothetical protein
MSGMEQLTISTPGFLYLVQSLSPPSGNRDGHNSRIPDGTVISFSDPQGKEKNRS